jgi:TonB family protein
MPNTRFPRRLPCSSLVALLLPFLLATGVPNAQTVPATTELSPDAAAFLRAASPYGLADSIGTPLHLRISFDLLDPHGAPRQHFTFEQFIRNRTSTKTILQTTGFDQVQYTVPGGVRVTGDNQMPDGHFFMVRSAIISPINTGLLAFIKQNPERFNIASEDQTVAGKSVRCYSVTFNMAPNQIPSNYCFNDQNLLSSFTTLSRGLATVKSTVTFNDRIVPSDLIISQQGPTITAHLDLIEPLPDSSDAFFSPPPNAQPLQSNFEFPGPPVVAGSIPGGDAPPRPGSSTPPAQVNISAGVAAGMLIKHDPPAYPPNALAAHVSGTVVLQAVIGKDGHVIQVNVVSGPNMLAQAAMDAVKNWEYRPYLLNAQPVEVQTTVAVPFIPGQQ